MLVRCSCLPVIGNGWYEKVTLCVGVCMCTCIPIFVSSLVRVFFLESEDCLVFGGGEMGKSTLKK